MAALVLGGVHAGVGKSVLASGLAAALRSEGLTVSSYVVGPGLPQHPPELSSGVGQLPQHAAGLDGWLMSPDAARAAFHSLSAGADISLVEGCLGMFDSPGADGSEQGSTAQVTQWLQAPVVLVIDAQAFKSARSIVALLKGYAAVEGGMCVAGVILNKVANKVLLGELADALKAAALDVAVLGGVPMLDDLSSSNSSSKQLACPWSPGSTTSSSWCPSSQCQQQQQQQQQQLPCGSQQLGQLLAQHVDLQQLQAVAARAAVPQPLAPLPPAVRTYRVSMGIAHDEAFYQYFQQNLHMLGCAGVQLVPFSPLHDSKLPPGLSAVVLGGGAVAEWGQQLSANTPMLEALRAFAAAGGLVMGEGAALMYLSRSLQRPGRQQLCMVGLLPFHTKEQQQRPSDPLSYVAVNVQASAHPLLLPGSHLKGRAGCCCQVVEERLVGGLSAALAAAATSAATAAADQQQPDVVAGGSDGVAASAARPAPDGSNVGLRPMPVTHSYSCTPLGQQGTAAAATAAVEEGYTCGTVLGSCVQLHYGTCPEMVQRMVAGPCPRQTCSVCCGSSAVRQM
ncbi:P-loop containing nucleoside triphosphate hydrolase protein [Scenedesmus sp. NREL 46B-D3]|nr:P-loop containing nucleoside triphosphate hydrolase protein [Scenedesmus sp. NREL 46B-D3]